MVARYIFILLIIINTIAFKSEAKVITGGTKLAPFFCQYTNLLEIILTGFGDEFVQKIYEDYEKWYYGSIILEYDFINKQCEITDIIAVKNNDLYDKNSLLSKLKSIYEKYPYKIVDKDMLQYSLYPVDTTKNRSFHVKIIDQHFYKRYKKWEKYKSNIEGFSTFIRRDILSCIKNILGEGHEYYKYLLEKYAPLQPYDDWHPQGKIWIKPENE